MTRSQRVRILVVDDHRLIQTGMRYVLSSFPDLELVGEAGSGEEALALCDRCRPDVVLMDVHLPGIGGIEAASAMVERFPEVSVVMLTGSTDVRMVRAALRVGARGYVLKTTTNFDLVQSIRAASSGRSVLSPEVMDSLVGTFHPETVTAAHLTPREREILHCVVKGLNNVQIGAALHLSRSTVKYHLSNIFSKIGAATRTEAVAWAYEHELIQY
jgi:two-component system, NarL family, response regulator LiaR